MIRTTTKYTVTGNTRFTLTMIYLSTEVTLYIVTI